MKKTVSLLLALLMLLSAAAMAEVKITATLFPQYDFARIIAGDHAEVTKFLPMGADSHSYEPTVRKMLEINGSDLFLYTDPEMEPWAEGLTGGLDDSVKIVECAEGIDLVALNEQWEASHEEEEEEEEHHDHDHEHAYDAHIWLDPTLAAVMCENIRDALIEVDPDNAADYTANAEAYIAELNALDAEIEETLAGCAGGTVVFGGRFSYSHFLRRYGLEFLTAYSSCDAESEPSARQMVRIIEAMKEKDIRIVFTDELSDGRIADSIAKETGAEVKVFHTLHNLNDEEVEAGCTYLSLMEQNLIYLKEALQ